MSCFKKYVLVLGLCILLSTHLQAAISDDDINKTVGLQKRDEAQSLRLGEILKEAVKFELTDEALEAVNKSKSAFMNNLTPLPELAQHTHDVLEKLGLICALSVAKPQTIEALHDQLAWASSLVCSDIVAPLSYLSAYLSIREGVKNCDPDGRLARINAVIAKWDKARAFTNTAAFYIGLNHDVD